MKVEFDTELRKIQQFGNTQCILIEALEKNIEFRECLFEEFKKAPKKKDFGKYLNTFYTDEQIEEDFYPPKSNNLQQSKTARFIETSKIEEDINQKEIEFYSLKETPQKFFTHDITKTNIYKKFKNIETVTREFMQTMLEPERKAEIISNIITTLHPDIKEAVLNALIEDNDNTYMYINFVIHGATRNDESKKEKWEFVKIVFNDKLIEYKNNLSKKESEPRTKTELETKQFYDYITLADTTNLKPFLKNVINGSKPKDVIVTLKALEKHGILNIPASGQRVTFYNALRNEFKKIDITESNNSFNNHIDKKNKEFLNDVENKVLIIKRILNQS